MAIFKGRGVSSAGFGAIKIDSYAPPEPTSESRFAWLDISSGSPQLKVYNVKTKQWESAETYAKKIKFDNTGTDLNSTNVYDAINEMIDNLKIRQQNTEPSNPKIGDLWINTSQHPHILRRYDGTEWVGVSSATVESFLSMGDTPNSYLGEKGKFLRVNDKEDGVIFDDKIDGGSF